MHSVQLASETLPNACTIYQATDNLPRHDAILQLFTLNELPPQQHNYLLVTLYNEVA